METSLEKYQSQLEAFNKECFVHREHTISIGQKYINRDGYTIDILDIKFVDEKDWDHFHKTKEEKTKSVAYFDIKHSVYSDKQISYQEFVYQKWVLMDNPDEINKIASEYLSTGEFPKEFKVNDTTESTDLVSMKSTEGLTAVADSLVIASRKAEAIQRAMHGMIEKQMRALNELRSKMLDAITVMNKQIKKIRKVIHVISLYLGIDEDIIQLQEGNNADISEPINIRQQILFMDEELAITGDESIDFKNYELFDEWLFKLNHEGISNYKILLPEVKGIVALKIRRKAKDYYDPELNAIAKIWNAKSFLLIRNGDNIYRIWADIDVHNRLFPLKTELMDMMNTLDEVESKQTSNYEKDKEEIDDKINVYKYNMILLQGLIMRTDIFKPIPDTFNFTKPDTYGNYLNFIYDDEVKLTDGRLSLKEWIKEINKSIKKGSRIYFKQFSWDEGNMSKDNRERFVKYYEHDYSMPKMPSSGVYELEEVEADTAYYRRSANGKYLAFKYHAGGEVYSWNDGYSERKNRTTFLIFDADLKSDRVLNYDQISVDDLIYYMHSRINRINYETELPLIRGIYKARLEEIELEKEFVKMMIGKTNKSEKEIWDALDWWKHKNSIKRPLSKDDVLAIRMIEKKLT